jgi:Flp pilus assembly protein TadG
MFYIVNFQKIMLNAGDSIVMMNSIKDERGSTLIEFAAVLVVLLALTFGMIDFGRYIYAISVVRSAAQEGARAGLVNVDDVETAVKEKMIALDASQADVTVTKPTPETVEVKVVYKFQFITPLSPMLALISSKPVAVGSNAPVEISGSASMVIY